MKGRPYSTKEEKIAWMIANADLWAHEFIDIKTAPKRLTNNHAFFRLKCQICKALRDARMVSPTNNCGEVGIHSMMNIAIERMKDPGTTR